MGRGTRRASAMDRILRWQSQKTAAQIARIAMETVAGPEAYCENPLCPARIRYLKAVELAAHALDVGNGHSPVITPEPACSGRVAAEARMAAGQR